MSQLTPTTAPSHPPTSRKLPIVPLPNPSTSAPSKSSPVMVLGGLQARYRLVLGAAALAILAVVVITRTLATYNAAYEQFRGIVEDNSILVDTSEQALQYIAGATTSAADFIGTTLGSKNNNEAFKAVSSNFQSFRDQVFKLREGLNGRESILYSAIETRVYDYFWPEVGIAIADQQAGNKDGARLALIKADTELETTIAEDLHKIETDNFQTMVTAEQQSGGAIVGQALILGALAFGLAALLTVLSIWLRRTIRRYLTPGLDAAMILSWALLIVMIAQLFGLPGQLRSMVEDAYYSVTASSRVLAVANQGNRAESAALIDLGNVARWQHDFDTYSHEVELRLCGQTGCLAKPFTQPDAPDTITSDVLVAAGNISSADSRLIGGIVPLVGNVTFPGEASTLEAARVAYLDYFKIDGQTRQLIAANRIPEAITLNTGTAVGQSDEAFNRFSVAMEKEKTINRTVFDNIWQTQRESLPVSSMIFGLAGYTLLILLLAAGVYHRVREL